MLRRTAPLLFIASLALLVGCSDSDPPASESCENNDDCAVEETCVEGACVAPDAGGDVASDADAGGEDTSEDVAEDAPPIRDIPQTDVDEDVAEDVSEDVEVGADAMDVTDEEEVTYPPLSFVTTPADGDTFVDRDTDITVRFNQPMNSLRFIPSNFTLTAPGSENIVRDIAYDDELYELTLSMPEDGELLRPVTPYAFTMVREIGSVSGENIGSAFRMTFSTTGYDGRVFLRQLAEAYAPVVYQQVETDRIDTFSRIDFDGNYIGADNLDNATGANYGYVYFDVIESVTHWFITYMIYYPGNNPRADIFAEHDLITVQVVVQKDDEDPLGRLRAFSTVHQSTLNSWAVESSFYEDGDAPTNNDQTIDGRLRLSDLEDGRHVTVFVESGRHSICLLNQSVTIPSCAPFEGATAPFEPDTTGLVYRAGETPQREGDAANDALTYSLRSFVEEFWALRDRTSGDDSLFGGEIDYEPPIIGEGDDGVPRPGTGETFPTSLNAINGDDGQFGELPFVFDATGERTERGVFFVDPAYAAPAMLTFPETFSDAYCFNPYLNIDQRDTLEGCTPTTFVIETPAP